MLFNNIIYVFYIITDYLVNNPKLTPLIINIMNLCYIYK